MTTTGCAATAHFASNGNDTLDGGRGNDILEGGDGNDTIRARDGFADTVDCGIGTDEATVDTIDTVAGCETVAASAELEPDRDSDGFDAPADCDDHDPLIKPGVLDVPENGIDEDCNGADARILDRDGDGFNVPQDCDDASRAISPGADEIRGNAVDEDCSGRADPFATPQAEIASRWRMTERGAKALRLIVSGAPAGAVVELRCRGGRLPEAAHGADHGQGGRQGRQAAQAAPRAPVEAGRPGRGARAGRRHDRARGPLRDPQRQGAEAHVAVPHARRREAWPLLSGCDYVGLCRADLIEMDVCPERTAPVPGTPTT